MTRHYRAQENRQQLIKILSSLESTIEVNYEGLQLAELYLSFQNVKVKQHNFQLMVLFQLTEGIQLISYQRTHAFIVTSTMLIYEYQTTASF